MSLSPHLSTFNDGNLFSVKKENPFNMIKKINNLEEEMVRLKDDIIKVVMMKQVCLLFPKI